MVTRVEFLQLRAHRLYPVSALACSHTEHKASPGSLVEKHLEERKGRLNPSLISLENINTPRGRSYGREGPVALEIHLGFISAPN